MAIGGIPPIGAGAAGGGFAFDGINAPGQGGGPATPRVGGIGDGPDFGETLKRGIEAVSDAEHAADEVAQNIASGGPAEIHDLMVATSKASLSVDLLVQVRNRAVEAYQEIMRMQV